MDGDLIATSLKLVSVLVLVGANAFFVASEFSLVAARRSRIEQLVSEGNQRARGVQEAQAHLDRYIAATQLGITLASLALGWVAESALARLVEPIFGFLPGIWPWISAYGVAVAIAFVVIAVLHVVLGELVPKAAALQRSETTAMIVTPPLRLFLVVFGPFITAMRGLSNGVARLLRLQPAGGYEVDHSEEELRLLVTASQESGVLEASEEEMLHKVFGFADKEAHQVMVPRTEIASLPADMALREFVAYVASEHIHTRFPVYEGSIDSIVGIVHLKDAVMATATNQLDQSLRSVMRPVLVVPESIHIDELLRELRRRRTHMAVLVDEYGGTAGIVTMEDLLEEIVGEIRDEFDEETPGLAARQDGTYSIDGLMMIDEFNQRFGLDIDDPAYDTIAGYVFGQLGRVAEVGDAVPVDGLVLRVEGMDGLRIASLRVLPAPGSTLTVEEDDLAVDEPPPPDRESIAGRTGTGG